MSTTFAGLPKTHHSHLFFHYGTSNRKKRERKKHNLTRTITTQGTSRRVEILGSLCKRDSYVYIYICRQVYTLLELPSNEAPFHRWILSPRNGLRNPRCAVPSNRNGALPIFGQPPRWSNPPPPPPPPGNAACYEKEDPQKRVLSNHDFVGLQV